jgi:hypothetical protein
VYALEVLRHLDGGATIGAYIGLLLIGGMYVAIGTLVSSFTDNQIISFIISAVICFVFFTGFDSLAEIIPSTINKNIITSIGIQQHYNSISRGVIGHTRFDLFCFCIIFFLYLTTLNIRKKTKIIYGIITTNKTYCNSYSSSYYSTLDFFNSIWQNRCYRDKRYTLNPSTVTFLEELQDTIRFLCIYMENNRWLFAKMKREVNDMLNNTNA